MKKRAAVLMLCMAILGLATSGCTASRESNANNEKAEETVMNLLNPISGVEEDTWYDYGTGDPYVMRYNGLYYLYMSTRDTEVGIKCFSSRDLITWHYEGICASEEITKGAYAPEVVYYNGMFYMYSSPAGNGHYVFSSNSPTGPFETVTKNLGFSIDGSVFIDNDGKWYFYHSGDAGIQAHEMSAPYDISYRAINVNAWMNGWTEGPMVIQHDGKYYLTYTGNHVLSKGYRINYGVGETPIKFIPAEENPVLIHTTGDVYGLGHSSSVKGPDLDSYYIVYHSLVGRAVEGMPKRALNIDRIVFNGDRMDILGPTVTQQQAPDMPEIYGYFDNGTEPEIWDAKDAHIADGRLQLEKKGYVLSKESLGDQFTAEYNVSSPDKEGRFGGYFNYQDKKNYAAFILDASKETVQIQVVQEGKTEESEYELVKSFDEPVDLSVIQAFQIEKKEQLYSIYFNDRHLGDFECNLSGGKIGYFVDGCSASFGFIGGSNVSGGLSACTYEKPLSGTIQGIHYAECSDTVEKKEGDANTLSVISREKDSFLDYTVCVESGGSYDFSMLYSATDDAAYALFQDGELISREREEIKTTGGQEEYKTLILRDVELTEGVHTLRIALYGEGIAVSQFTFDKHDNVEEISVTYDSILDDNVYSDGKWRIKGGELLLDEETQAVGKRLYGSENMGDYTVEADITFTGNKKNAGLVFRVKNPAVGGAGDNVSAGINFIQGYYAAIQENKLALAKINYEYEELISIPMDFESNRPYHMSITVDGANISVSIDGEECIIYEDEKNPFLQGSAGIRSNLSAIHLDNLKICPIIR